MNNQEKKQEAMHNANYTIDNIKMELLRHVDMLMEAGMVRKSKSLERIVGELEHWQHTR